jgi:hypothetical protein
MSPYITTGMKQRATAGTGRRRGPRNVGVKPTGQQQTSNAGTGAPGAQPATEPADLKSQLVGKFPAFDPNWDDAIKAKWFAGFQQLVDVVEKPARRRGQKQESE